MSRTGAIVQARMSSQRLPGKVLRKTAGKPMLQFLLERLQQSRQTNEIVVATSIDESDDPIAAFSKDMGVACYRGPLANVARRFLEVVNAFSFESFVRVNGDSPLLDISLLDHAIEEFRSGKWDLVTNVQVRSFPKGQSVEIIDATAFQKAFEAMSRTDELEHVTKHFYLNPENFRILNIHSGLDLGEVQLSVDTSKDMLQFEKIVQKMTRPHWEYGLNDILRIRSEAL